MELLKIDKPNLFGYVAKTPYGIDVEIVRCRYESWNVFLTRDDCVIARSVKEYREHGNDDYSFTTAKALAREMFNFFCGSC